MLKSLKFKDFYRSGEDNLVKDFYIPCLKNSKYYYRSTGYFNSSILNHLSQGLHNIINNNGKIKIVCGVQLTMNDKQQILDGYSKRMKVNEVICQKITDLIESDITDQVRNLAWLISNNYLDIRLAIPSNRKCGNTIFHEKLGIFEDDDSNLLAFTGSINESSNGWMYNYESFDVYYSWDITYRNRVKRKKEYFTKLWNNDLKEVDIYSFPEEAKEKIQCIVPEEIVSEESQLYTIKNNINKKTPRDYQSEAIDEWVRNDFKGIFEMATGTGKTITAIFSIKKFLEKYDNSFVVIACPFQHLVDQWETELKSFGYEIIKCYESKNAWLNDLANKVIDLNLGFINKLIVITTSTTGSMDAFQGVLTRVRSNIATLLVADEMHNLGSENRRKILSNVFQARLGLSATPKRWHDEKGTKALYDYFEKTVYEFGLKKAIEKGFLTKYEYFPLIVYLTEEEFSEYQKLTKKIIIAMNDKENSDEKKLEWLLIKRARIINSASNKLEKFEKLIDEQQNLKHTLVYTAPELKEDIYRVLQNKSIFFQRFTSKEDNIDRKNILKHFANGDTDVLVAMRCLDEGVNVPATRKAMILSSSTNPKEFIQRRGRVLRKYPGKEKAIIYDFLVVPPLNADVSSMRSVLLRELKRFKEFSELADNQIMARSVVFDLAKKFNLLDEV